MSQENAQPTTPEVKQPLIVQTKPLVASAANREAVIQQIVTKVTEAKEAEVKEESVAEPLIAAPLEDAATKPEALSPKLAQIKEQQRKLAEKEKSLLEREKTVSDKESLKKAIREKPIQTLTELGVSFQELAEAIVKDEGGGVPKDSGTLALEKAEELQAELARRDEAEKKGREQAEEQYVRRVYADYKNRLNSFVEGNKETYEYVHALGAQDLVFNIVEEYYNKHGVVPDMDKAAEAAEKYLESRAEQASKLNKFKSKFATQTDPKPAQKATLTNSMNGYSAPIQPKPLLSDKDARIKAAAKLLKYS